MTLNEIKTMLESITGFSAKVTYWSWPESKAPALPFICFHSPRANGFAADNIVYSSTNYVVIELYTSTKDVATEKLVEDKLTESGIYFTKTSNHLDDENCWFIQYEIEV